MTVAMFCFAMTDTLIKYNAGTISSPLVMFFLMCGGGIVFSAIALYERKLTFTKDAVSPVLIIRYLAEIAGVIGMVLALANAPLSTVGAIIQSVPLIVTLGAMIFLGERVSWRRWSAILVGFLGVLLIIQPGAQGFSPAVLWAILAAFGLAVRDLTTCLLYTSPSPRDA